MRDRRQAAVLTVIAVLVLAPLPAAGQPAAEQWTVPRTPDGQPDLQGVWSFATITPLGRAMPGDPKTAGALNAACNTDRSPACRPATTTIT